ncbi:hypothetical protein C8R45DRAFT_1075596 [Mycena sanguinolenta]|nr:hypothetical protein C8R45DRAFT_1075596 [Mycena sanguinolenta]
MSQGASRAILNNCQNFTISGGTFTTQVNASDLDESDFRRVRLGDLRLLKEVAKQNIVEYHEVLHKKTKAVKCRVPRVVGLRQIHQARVHGSREEFTAVVYQGSGFEKHRAHAERREHFRHPFLVQLFGLMPLDEFRKMHQQSPLVSLFLENETVNHFRAALTHWEDVTGTWLGARDSDGFWTQVKMGTVLWICLSTGQLCIEVGDNDDPNPTSIPRGLLGSSLSSRVHLTSDNNLEGRLLSHMSLDDIHHILSAAFRRWAIDIADPGTVLLGSLSWPTSSYAHLSNPFSEISLSDSLQLQDLEVETWEYTQWGTSPSNEELVLLPNGWTRVGLAYLPIQEECQLRKMIHPTLEALQEIRKCWLSQANHVMDKSGLDADEYFIIDYLSLHLSITFDLDPFKLQGTFMANTPRDDVYLFLPPAGVDGSGVHLAVHLPLESEKYYWSLDPCGIERLPQDSLEELALPHIKCWAQVRGVQWSKEVYDSITKFHCAKGFDPTSQDVAIELGYPLVDVDRLINLIYCNTIEVVDEVVESQYAETSATENGNDQANESEDIKSSVGDTHASGESPEIEPLVPQAEIMQVSGASKLLMNVQMTLFLFLALFWLYGQA